MINKKFIIVSGPTGVGKTDFAEKLAQSISLKTAIVNIDVGQFYKPLSIGTAKPDLSDVQYGSRYYLFDIIDQPKDLTASEFREILLKLLKDLWANNILPIIVGGSSFYVKSIFYPPISILNNSSNGLDFSNISTQDLYNRLKEVDEIRAQEIHSNDRYRIERALYLWNTTSIKPSNLKPKFDCPGECLFYYITREREELYSIINQRTYKMFDLGWLEEVKNLDNNWKKFLLKKKLIGYPEIIKYLDNSSFDDYDFDNLVQDISQKTRAYAKRQLIFWRSLKADLILSNLSKGFIKDIKEINLTLLNLDLYINQLCIEIEKFVSV
ncbi:tRNA (adenosine(37)-N6)-dimethylallyltransferase MiaA [Candidatus Babela massiliensis]|nr:tRNA (adenosine(37)-N6)-dimethylallyltransferase MiaA [Candidatus Babela massiliensis]